MDADRAELIARLFGVLSARLEDAGVVAGDGQSPSMSVAERLVLSSRIASLTDEIAVIARAVEVLAGAAD